MDKPTLIKKTKEIISRSDYKSLTGNYDDTPNIDFKDDSNVNCTIRFNYRIFGLVSYINLRRDYVEVISFKITKDEYRDLKKSISDKINQIKEQELGMVFKDITRDNKLNGMLDGK